MPVSTLLSQSDSAGADKSLFTDTTILQAKLYANFKTIQKDRGANPVYHEAKFAYKTEMGKDMVLPIKIKVRGNFRRDKTVCNFPPLLLHFYKHSKRESDLFKDQQNLKLVTQCQGDECVIHEWMVYKIYNLLTPFSFRARLIKMDYVDSSAHLKEETHYGILIEDETQMAQRNNCILVKRKMVTPQATQHEPYVIMTLFEYMIGNTDWSIPYLHNIRLITTDSTEIPCTVPYDFDHAGIVQAPYAKPAEELGLTSVQERLYRGCCLPYKDFDETIKTYNEKKEAIYKAYTSCVLLQPKYIKQTLAYLDEFYKIINNKKLREREFGKPCQAPGVEIKEMPDSE